MFPIHFSKFKKIMKVSGWDEGEEMIAISREGFRALLIGYVESNTLDFDSSWYIRKYPDIAKSIASGDLPSAKSHYIRHGYIEGRLPGFRNIDIGSYIESNTDLKSRIGDLKGKEREQAAITHFVEFGYKEGRSIPTKSENSDKR